MATTGWQAHTVRGMISILASKGGVKLESLRALSRFCAPDGPKPNIDPVQNAAAAII